MCKRFNIVNPWSTGRHARIVGCLVCGCSVYGKGQSFFCRHLIVCDRKDGSRDLQLLKKSVHGERSAGVTMQHVCVTCLSCRKRAESVSFIMWGYPTYLANTTQIVCLAKKKCSRKNHSISITPRNPTTRAPLKPYHTLMLW